MARRTRPVPVFDAAKLVADMTKRGLDAAGLADLAGLHHMTVRRFIDGEVQTIKTAVALATALGYDSPRRYFAGVRQEATS